MKNAKTELLSPAGDFECLLAAVKNGADAVYIGEKNLSARKNAKNFTWDEIKEACEYCHERGVRVYLAMNTLMKREEWSVVADAVRQSAKTGIDALIIQDLAVAQIANEICPDMPIHASTQLTAHSAADVRELMKLGFSRVVLSREMSQDEIRAIYEETDCEIEAFVHGALCICFSGQCLMSSFIGGRSGNRGCCAQPCRRSYSAEGKTGFFLSPRDLCLAKKIREMKDAGVISFKIEGRMKNPQYVALVTNVYRKALDGLMPSEEDMLHLRQIFSRGGEFTQGYFSGINTPEMMNYHISNDGISNAAPKEVISYANELCRGENGRVGVSFSFYAREGEPISLCAADESGNEATSLGAVAQRAQKTSLTREKAEESLKKCGSTAYIVQKINTDMQEGLFVSASALNSLRRECLEKLGEQRRKIKPRKTFGFSLPELEQKERERQKTVAFVRNKEQLEAVSCADIKVLPLHMASEVNAQEHAFYLPRIILDKTAVTQRLSMLPEGTRVYASTLGALETVLEAGMTPVGDFALNVYNPLSAKRILEKAESVTLSPELNLGEITQIATKLPSEIIAYGRQEVMVSRACLIRGIRGRCDCRKPVLLKDKTGAEFYILGDEETHLNTVLNSRVTFMADKLKELRKSGADAIQLRFTLESAAETEKIVQMYKNGGKYDKEFTRGYFFK